MFHFSSFAFLNKFKKTKAKHTLHEEIRLLKREQTRLKMKVFELEETVRDKDIIIVQLNKVKEALNKKLLEFERNNNRFDKEMEEINRHLSVSKTSTDHVFEKKQNKWQRMRKSLIIK